MSDVILIYPNVPKEMGRYHQEMIPLGLASLGAFVEQAGLTVKMFDLKVEDARLVVRFVRLLSCLFPKHLLYLTHHGWANSTRDN